MFKRVFGRADSRKGFSITELLFVMIITTVVVTTIVSLWMFSNQVWMRKSEQTMLRIELMKALEIMKSDIRLSSFTDMVFYPEDSATYTAVSVPLADVDSNGLVEISEGSEGKIIWSRTVIYHIHTDASGDKVLRRTTYDPRDNTLTEAERYNQMESVVLNGTGGSGSTTETDFLKGLDTFEISPLSSVFDFYAESATPIKVGKVVFGWARLDPGEHTIRFEIAGKNDLSYGYDLGLDSIMIEPCGSVREAEYYLSAYAPLGAISVSGGSAALVEDDVWGNKNYLEFRASGAGDYVEFTDYYDLWRESSFEENTFMNNAELTGSEVRAALSVPEEEDEGEFAWFAYIASGEVNQEGLDGNFNTIEAKPDMKKVVLRTVVRSSVTNMSDQEIDPDRALVRIRLKSSSTSPVTIDSAYITKRDSSGGYNGVANSAPFSPYDPLDYHSHQQLFFRDATGSVSSGVTIDADSEVFSLWSAYPLHTDNDYFITIYISDAASLDCRYWQGSSLNTYFINIGETINCSVSGNTFTASAHGLAHGDTVVVDFDLSVMSGTPNWSSAIPYIYVVEYQNANSFKLKRNLNYYEPQGLHTVNLWQGVINDTDNIHFIANIDTWDVTGSVESKAQNTALLSPSYNEISYSENRPSGSSILMKVRTASDESMSGAPAWDTISGSTNNPYNLVVASDRYVQFQGEFSAEPYWKEEISGSVLSYRNYVSTQKLSSDSGSPHIFPSSSGKYYTAFLETPWIDDVTIDWPGSSTICALTGYVAKKDSYGQAMITIDGEALLKVLSLHLKITKDVSGKTIEARNYIEIEPRNTGK